MTTQGRQKKGWSLSSRILAKSEVMWGKRKGCPHSGAVSVKQTVAWLAIISVLLTQSIIPVENLPQKREKEGGNEEAVSISSQVMYLRDLWCWKRGVICFPWDVCTDWGVAVCLFTGWSPAKLNSSWKVCSNYWRLQGTTTEVWQQGTLKIGGWPILKIENPFELHLS